MDGDAGSVVLTIDKATLQDGRGILHMRARVTDEALWDAIVDRLDGHKFYATEDLRSEAFQLLKDRLEQTKKDLKAAEHAKKEAEERLAAERVEWAREVRICEDKITRLEVDRIYHLP
jgi:hypothetical protein